MILSKSGSLVGFFFPPPPTFGAFVFPQIIAAALSIDQLYPLMKHFLSWITELTKWFNQEGINAMLQPSRSPDLAYGL